MILTFLFLWAGKQYPYQVMKSWNLWDLGLLLGVGWFVGYLPWTPKIILLSLVALSYIDHHYHIISLRFLVVMLWGGNYQGDWYSIFLLGVLLLLVQRGNLGMGDVLVLGILSIYYPFYHVQIILLCSCVLALVSSVFGDRKTEIPFIPYLCGGYLWYLCQGL